MFGYRPVFRRYLNPKCLFCHILVLFLCPVEQFPFGRLSGLLRRASIVAGEVIPVGKETDRHWEQGEDMSLLDFQILEHRSAGKLRYADATLIETMRKFSLRELMRKTGLSQKAVYAILRGQPVRQRTLATLRFALRT